MYKGGLIPGFGVACSTPAPLPGPGSAPELVNLLIRARLEPGPCVDLSKSRVRSWHPDYHTQREEEQGQGLIS